MDVYLHDMLRKEKLRVDFSSVDSDFRFLLGRVNFARAQKPLETHSHEECMEIVYLSRGTQTYVIGDREYKMNGGDIFVTLPYENHSSGPYPEEKILLYYLIIDMENADGFLGYPPDEGRELHQALMNINKRLFKSQVDSKFVLDRLLKVFFSDCRFKKILIRNLVTEFLINVINSEKNPGTKSKGNFDSVLEYIDDNIYDDICIEALARMSSLSVSRFKANFKAETGIPPHEYILRRKIEKAKQLMTEGVTNITDIAYLLNFASSQHFSATFKKFTYKTPKEYLKDIK